jgi:hypothetical protein
MPAPSENDSVCMQAAPEAGQSQKADGIEKPALKTGRA